MNMLVVESLPWKTFMLFLFTLPSTIKTERGGFLYFKFLCYTNPGHLDVKGDLCDSFTPHCDPYFTICISHQYLQEGMENQKCLIYSQTTSTYQDSESICSQPIDNRGYLKNEIKMELSFPLPKVLYVKIDVKDFDSWKKVHSHIASFSTEFQQLPSPSFSTPIYKEIPMFRNEFRYANPKARLTISMALQCDQDRYGPYCLDFCRATAKDNYICSNDGKIVCKKGWIGENCLTKDPCDSQPCIKGAECILINGKPNCKCKGQFSPECESNYNPCKNNPCKNSGQCVRNEGGFSCFCNTFYYGIRCEIKRNPCDPNPCLNNAKCTYYEMDSYRCHCLEGFVGSFCQNRTFYSKTFLPLHTRIIGYSKLGASTLAFKNKVENKTLMTIFTFLFGLSLLALLVILLFCSIKRRIRNKYKLNREKKTPIVKYKNRLNSPQIVSNEYFEKSQSENVYEIIKDSETYACIDDAKDDYMVPTNPRTRLEDISAKEESDYLEMSDKCDNYQPPIDRVIVQSDSFYLPSLPTRDFKNKPTLRNLLFSKK